MLQALRFVIQGAGAKVDAAIRKNVVSMLLSMLGHDEVRLGGKGGVQFFPFSFLGWPLCFLVEELGTAAAWLPVTLLPGLPRTPLSP